MLQKRISFSKQDWGNRLSIFITDLHRVVPDLVTTPSPEFDVSLFTRVYRTQTTTQIVLALRLKADTLSEIQKKECVLAINTLLTELETLHRHKSHDAKVDQLRITLAKTRDVLQKTLILEPDTEEDLDLSKVVFSRQPLAQFMQATALATPALRDTGNALITGLSYLLGAAKADGWDEMALVAQGSGLPKLFPTLIYTQFSVLLLFFGLPNVIHELHEHAAEYGEMKVELSKKVELLTQFMDEVEERFKERLHLSFKDLLRNSLFSQFEKTPSKLKSLQLSFKGLDLSQKAFKAWKINPNRQNVEQTLMGAAAQLQGDNPIFTADDQACLEEGFDTILDMRATLQEAKQELVGHGLEFVTFLGMGSGMAFKAVGAFLDKADAVGEGTLELISETLGGLFLGVGQIACMAGASYDSLAIVTLILRRHFEETFKGREFGFKDAVKALSVGINWKAIEPELRLELKKSLPKDVKKDQEDAYISSIIRDVKCDFDEQISKLRSRMFNNALIFTGQGILLLGIINSLWSFGFSTLVSASIGGPITIFAIIRNLLAKSQDSAHEKKYPHISHGEVMEFTTEKKRNTQCYELMRSAIKLSIHRKLAKGDSGLSIVKRWEKDNGFFNKSPFWRSPIANAKAYKTETMAVVKDENNSLHHNDPSKSYYENYANYYRNQLVNQNGTRKMNTPDFLKLAKGSLGRLWGKKDISKEDIIHFALDFQQHPHHAAKIRRALIALSDKQGKPLTHESVIKLCLETPKLQKMILDKLYDRSMEDIARLRKSGYQFDAKHSQPERKRVWAGVQQDPDIIF